MIIVSDPALYAEKESLYIKVRDKEGRVIPDSVLLQLPDTDTNSPYKQEWDIRKQNLERLLKYLHARFKNKAATIIDVGCGNGWMTHALYEQGYSMHGVDLNLTELQQAEKVFGTNNTLKWYYADIMKDVLPIAPADIILLSASCQYFPDLYMLTERLLPILSTNGEIHLVDSIFYDDTLAARQRSEAYYNSIGFPQMSQYYFHHSVKDLKKAGYKKLYPGFFNRSVLQWWCRAK